MKKELRGIPKAEKNKILEFYSEIINDKKDLYTSKQLLTEMVTKKTVDYLFNDEQVSIITAHNSDILAEGKSKGGFFKSIKKFFVGIKNYYWGA